MVLFGNTNKNSYIYDKILKMTQEQLRMQMLAGIITESQHKEKIEEMDKVQSLDDLKKGDIYHLKQNNSNGEDITTDYEYVNPIGSYDFKFRLVKSYMDDKTKEKYKKLGLDMHYTPGKEVIYTIQYLRHVINKGQLYKL